MKCVNCGNIFNKVETTKEDDTISGGFCDYCAFMLLVNIYRRAQKAKGYSDCFGKARGFCDQGDCRYQKHCLSPVRPAAEEIERFYAQPQYARFAT